MTIDRNAAFAVAAATTGARAFELTAWLGETVAARFKAIRRRAMDLVDGR